MENPHYVDIPLERPKSGLPSEHLAGLKQAPQPVGHPEELPNPFFEEDDNEETEEFGMISLQALPSPSKDQSQPSLAGFDRVSGGLAFVPTRDNQEFGFADYAEMDESVDEDEEQFTVPTMDKEVANQFCAQVAEEQLNLMKKAVFQHLEDIVRGIHVQQKMYGFGAVKLLNFSKHRIQRNYVFKRILTRQRDQMLEKAVQKIKSRAKKLLDLKKQKQKQKEGAANIPPPPPMGMGIPPPPPMGIPGPPPPPGLLGGPGALFNMVAKPFKKKTNDPKPPKGTKLKKVPIQIVRGPAASKTFWITDEERLLEQEKDLRIDWGSIDSEFPDLRKVKEGKEKDSSGGASATPKQPEYIEVLTADTAKRVGIVFSRFSLSIEETEKLIREFSLSFEQVTQINSAIPQKESEFKELKEWEGDEKLLRPSTLRLFRIVKIPMVRKVIGCLRAKFEFEQDYNIVHVQMKMYLEPLGIAIDDKDLQRFLNVFLRIINYLNAGGPRESSVGFSLTTIRDLHKVKSTSNQSLLFYVVSMIKKKQPQLLEFLKSYEGLARLVKSDPKTFQKKIKEFGTYTTEIRKQMVAVQKIRKMEKCSEEEKNIAQKFEGYFQPFLDSASGKIDSLEELSREISRKGSKLAEVYGLDRECTSKDFLELMNNFIDKIKDSLIQIDKQVKIQKRKNMLELKQRQALGIQAELNQISGANMSGKRPTIRRQNSGARGRKRALNLPKGIQDKIDAQNHNMPPLGDNTVIQNGRPRRKRRRRQLPAAGQKESVARKTFNKSNPLVQNQLQNIKRETQMKRQQKNLSIRQSQAPETPRRAARIAERAKQAELEKKEKEEKRKEAASTMHVVNLNDGLRKEGEVEEEGKVMVRVDKDGFVKIQAANFKTTCQFAIYSNTGKRREMRPSTAQVSRPKQSGPKAGVGCSMKEFKIMGEIGKGSYGVVFKVLSLIDKKEYVLKKIPIKHLRKSEIQDVVKEAKILRQLEHTHIVKSFSHFLEGGSLHIVMEYARGGDLQKFVKTAKRKNKTISERIIWRMAKELAEALSYLHAHNIIHRDIKTLNVFIDENKHVKLGDMGVSKIVVNQLGAQNTRVGTPLYLSPELVKHKPYDYKIDIWAMGCVLFHLCNLGPPFYGENLISLGYNIVNKSPKPIAKHYSKELQALIFSLLDKKPTNRPSAKEAASTITKIIKQKMANQEFGDSKRGSRAEKLLQKESTEDPKKYKGMQSMQNMSANLRKKRLQSYKPSTNNKSNPFVKRLESIDKIKKSEKIGIDEINRNPKKLPIEAISESLQANISQKSKTSDISPSKNMDQSSNIKTQNETEDQMLDIEKSQNGGLKIEEISQKGDKQKNLESEVDKSIEVYPVIDAGEEDFEGLGPQSPPNPIIQPVIVRKGRQGNNPSNHTQRAPRGARSPYLNSRSELESIKEAPCPLGQAAVVKKENLNRPFFRKYASQKRQSNKKSGLCSQNLKQRVKLMEKKLLKQRQLNNRRIPRRRPQTAYVLQRKVEQPIKQLNLSSKPQNSQALETVHNSVKEMRGQPSTSGNTKLVNDSFFVGKKSRPKSSMPLLHNRDPLAVSHPFFNPFLDPFPSKTVQDRNSIISALTGEMSQSSNKQPSEKRSSRPKSRPLSALSYQKRTMDNRSSKKGYRISTAAVSREPDLFEETVEVGNALFSVKDLLQINKTLIIQWKRSRESNC